MCGTMLTPSRTGERVKIDAGLSVWYASKDSDHWTYWRHGGRGGAFTAPTLDAVIAAITPKDDRS